MKHSRRRFEKNVQARQDRPEIWDAARVPYKLEVYLRTRYAPPKPEQANNALQ